MSEDVKTKSKVCDFHREC